MSETIEAFAKALRTMSHSRAGWDYQMSPAQRAAEDREERDALAVARSLWAENPDMREALREAFKDTNPLASMQEIEGV